MPDPYASIAQVDKGMQERLADVLELRAAPPNAFGVIDHDVTLESGVTIQNAVRIVPNGEGSEFVSPTRGTTGSSLRTRRQSRTT